MCVGGGGGGGRAESASLQEVSAQKIPGEIGFNKWCFLLC